MPKVLIVDDDEQMRGLMRMRLTGACQIIDTGDPAQAIALALEHKPDAILLDLMMPKFSGFELCQSLRSLSYTSRIPIFVITGEASAKYKEHCEQLGATAFFEKPIDFSALKNALAAELETGRPERRSAVRVRMRLNLKLRGIDVNGQPFQEAVTTENVSAGGFLCGCPQALAKESVVEVTLTGTSDRFVGKAKVVRKEAGAPWPRYGFQFVEKNTEWILQG